MIYRNLTKKLVQDEEMLYSEEFNKFCNAVFEYIPDSVMGPEIWDGDGHKVEQMLLDLYQDFLKNEKTPLENYAQMFVFSYFHQKGKTIILPSLPQINSGEVYTKKINKDFLACYVVLSRDRYIVKLRLTSRSEFSAKSYFSSSWIAESKYIEVSYPDLQKDFNKL